MADPITMFGLSQNVFVTILLLVVVWDVVWRGIALWKSARNKQLVWFVFLLIVNSVGILPIIYIVFFSKKKRR